MVPNANTTKPTNNAQNPVEASIGIMPINDRNPTAASITAIQKTITLGALSLIMTPPFTIQVRNQELQGFKSFLSLYYLSTLKQPYYNHNNSNH
jgi:hypothetical protein